MAAALAEREEFAARIGQDCDANVIRRSAIGRQRRQFRDESSIVRGVVALAAGIPRGMHAWPAIQAGHDQAAILRKRPRAGCPSDSFGLQPRIRLEGRARFFDFGNIRAIVQIAKLNRQIAEYLDDLLPLLSVPSAKH